MVGRIPKTREVVNSVTKPPISKVNAEGCGAGCAYAAMVTLFFAVLLFCGFCLAMGFGYAVLAFSNAFGWVDTWTLVQQFSAGIVVLIAFGLAARIGGGRK